MSARGVPEYEFNLKPARAIERELSGAGFRSTLVLITGGATFAGLGIAREARQRVTGRLFLSIHHDSVSARFLDVWDHQGVDADTVIASEVILCSCPTRIRKRPLVSISLSCLATN